MLQVYVGVIEQVLLFLCILVKYIIGNENELNVQDVLCFQGLPISGNSPQTIVGLVLCLLRIACPLNPLLVHPADYHLVLQSGQPWEQPQGQQDE